jgi:hypothetical protein
MLKVIKQCLVDEIGQHLTSSGFERGEKIKGVPAREYSVFRKQLNNGGAVFITLYVKVGRDHVTPSLQWSNDGCFPVYEESQYLLKQGDRSQDDIGWLFGDRFNRAYSYDLPHEAPSPERIKEISQNKDNLQIMISHGMDDFPDDDGWWHDWELIDEFFPHEITEKDINYAVGSLAEEVTSLIRDCFLPYLEELKISQDHSS